jgi:hypothetical protein
MEEFLSIDSQEMYDFEEAHYHHIINDFASLVDVYGFKTVFTDLMNVINGKDGV